MRGRAAGEGGERREGSEHKYRGEAEGEGNGWKVVKVVRRECNRAEMERRSNGLRKGRREKVAVRTKKLETEEKRKMISGRRQLFHLSKPVTKISQPPPKLRLDFLSVCLSPPPGSSRRLQKHNFTTVSLK